MVWLFVDEPAAVCVCVCGWVNAICGSVQGGGSIGYPRNAFKMSNDVIGGGGLALHVLFVVLPNPYGMIVFFVNH